MKHNGTIADQCKQRGMLCHIGLVKDRGGHLVNQPRLSLFVKYFVQYSIFASQRPQVRTWGTKLVSYPGRHLTSLRPWLELSRVLDSGDSITAFVDFEVASIHNRWI